MPYLVYIREARDDEVYLNEELLLDFSDVEDCSIKEFDAKHFAIFAADGECLAIMQDKNMALAWARENNLTPQSVH